MPTRHMFLAWVFLLLLPAGLRADEESTETFVWPVPLAGTQVAYRTVITFASDVTVGDMTLEAVHLEREHGVQVQHGADGGGVRVVLTQGRRGGWIRAKDGGASRKTPLPMVVTRRSHALAGFAEAAGTQVDFAVDSGGRPEVAPGPVEGLAQSAFACGHLLPAPPPEAPREGLAWEAAATPPVGAEEDTPPIPAGFEISSVDADTVTVEVAWPDMAQAGHWAFASLKQELVISRKDGLPIRSHFEGGVTTRIPHLAGVIPMRVEGTMVRRAPVEAPASPSPVDARVVDLAADSPEVRAKAAAALGRLWPGGALAVPALIALLDDEDDAVRKAATKSLEALGDRAAPEVAAFLTSTEEPEAAACIRTLDTIRTLGARVTPMNMADLIDVAPQAGSLLLVLGFADPDLDPHAATADVVAPLVARVVRDGLELSDPDTNRLAAAAVALAGCARIPASTGRRTPSEVIELVNAPDPSVAWSATVLLMRLGAASDEVRTSLHARAEREVTDGLTPAAGAALRRLGYRAPQDPQWAALASENLWTRARAAASFAGRREEAEAAVPVLVGALEGMDFTKDNEATELGWEIVLALGRFGAESAAATPALEEALEAVRAADPALSPLKAAGLAAALCRISGPREPWVDLVIAGLRDAAASGDLDGWPADFFLEAISVPGAGLPPACTESVRKALDDLVNEGPVGMVPSLLHALGRLGEASAASVPTILDALQAVEDARKEKLRRDGWDPTAKARWLAEEGSLYPVVAGVRQDAVDALGAIKKAAKNAVPTLEELVVNGEPAIRVRAARALRRIQRE